LKTEFKKYIIRHVEIETGRTGVQRELNLFEEGVVESLVQEGRTPTLRMPIESNGENNNYCEVYVPPPGATIDSSIRMFGNEMAFYKPNGAVLGFADHIRMGLEEYSTIFERIVLAQEPDNH